MRIFVHTEHCDASKEIWFDHTHERSFTVLYSHSLTISCLSLSLQMISTPTHYKTTTIVTPNLQPKNGCHTFFVSYFANFMCFVSHSSHSFRAVLSFACLEISWKRAYRVLQKGTKRDSTKKHATLSQITKQVYRVHCTVCSTNSEPKEEKTCSSSMLKCC